MNRTAAVSRGLVFRRLLHSFNWAEQPRLRINSTAPNFVAQTTHGELDLHRYLGDSWGVLFSHPKDFTPVCTTELGAFAKLKPEFDKRNTKLIGLSAEDVESHKKWVKDIEEISGLSKFSFPIIADPNHEVAFLYDMIDEETAHALKKDPKALIGTIRSVFVIDPSKKLRLTLTYPSSVGRNTAEVLRVIDALQKTDEMGVVTPINWQAGQDVIIPPTISDKDASEKFGEFKTIKPYLRFTKSD